MDTAFSSQVTEEIEALKASMYKLAGDLSHTTLPPQSLAALGEPLAELLLALQKIPNDYQRQFECVLDFNTAIQDAQSCPELAPIVCSQLADILTADYVALVMHDEDEGDNVIAHTHGIGPFAAGQRLPAGLGLIGQVIATGKPYYSADVNRSAADIHAAVGAPMITLGQVIGLLWISRAVEFSQDELRLIWLLSDLAALAMHRTDTWTTLLESRMELARANLYVREIDNLKAKFINDVSHELRTPITGLNMVLYLLERNGQEKYAQYLSNLREEVERLTNFSESILDITRLESKLNNAQLQPLDFNVLVTQLAAIYATRAEQANVIWDFAGANTPLMVTGDQNLLLTAVGNLLTNAINYALQGKVIVQVFHDERRRCATLVTENNGIGVDARELPHLFDRFYRGSRVAELSIPGAGLGLAVVKEIVDFHHGQVEAESTNDGKMRFTMRLPLNS